MAIFVGDFNSFKKYLNDYVKNKIPVQTKKYKTGNCELCGKKTELDSAHKRGNERDVIIKRAFDKAGRFCGNSQYEVDLDKFAQHIFEEHTNPDNFHFICRECHRKYDAKDSQIKESDFKKTVGTGVNNRKANTTQWPFKKNKSGAINCCRAKGVKITDNVCFASIKQSLYRGQEVYWADMDDSKFLSNDWTFILNNQHNRRFYVIFVPKGKLTPNLAKAGRNKGLFDWNIRSSVYCDMDTMFDLKQFGVQEVAYSAEDVKAFDS